VTDTAETTLELRPATEGDCPRIVDLVESAYRGDRSRAGWTTEADLLDGQRTDLDEVRAIVADPQARIVLAFEAGELVGNIVARNEPDGVHIGMFAVRPTLQARGIGRLLLEAAERVATSEFSSTRAVLHVLTRRSELLAWYERRGYRDTGARERFPEGNPRVGIPRVPDLEFAIMGKSLRL
jgi:ribosomal protein S18 acetylase RimI-like enzyme